MPRLSVSSSEAAALIPSSAWERLCPPEHPFLNGIFFRTLEEFDAATPRTGWQANHGVAHDTDGRVIGILPTYIKSHSHGDFLRDWPWAAAYRQLGKAYYPKLVSGIPHTPVAGQRFLAESGEIGAAVWQQTIDTIKTTIRENSLSSWHIALPADEEIEQLAANGFLISHDVQFHWHNKNYREFDEFLARFPAEKRRKVKAERRKATHSGLTLEIRHGNDIDADEWPEIHRIYATTFEKYGNYAAFSPACFAQLGLRLGPKMVLFIARSNGIPVALSLCFRSYDTLYGRYWGTLGDFNSLHFELCFYQGIAYCIEHGLKTFEPGAGGEHKVARGFEPTIVRSCHWIEDQRMRQLIGQHLAASRQSIFDYADQARQHLPFKDTKIL